jgi:hypothetical protein
VIAIINERAALNNPVLLGCLAVAVEGEYCETPEGGKRTALGTVLEESSRRRMNECTSIIRSRVEKVLRRCQAKVDLILDEVESKVHVVSTEVIYCIL